MIVTRFVSLAHKVQELPERWLGKDVYLHGLLHESKIFHLSLHNSTLRNLELCSTFFKFLERLMQVLNMPLTILTGEN